MREMDTRRPGAFFPGGRVKFDEKGRRDGAELLICSAMAERRAGGGVAAGLGDGEAGLVEAIGWQSAGPT